MTLGTGLREVTRAKARRVSKLAAPASVFLVVGRAILLIWLLAMLGCAERGLPDYEYASASHPAFGPSPVAERATAEYRVRVPIPARLPPGAAVSVYRSGYLRGADVDGAPLDVSGPWAVTPLPANAAGKRLTLRYVAPFPIVDPVVSFGAPDALALQALRPDHGPFGLGFAMIILGVAALVAVAVRPNLAWASFGVFVASMGTMTALEDQAMVPFFSIGTARDVVHEAALTLIGAGFAVFLRETSERRGRRLLGALAIASLALAVVATALHLGGLVPARRFRAGGEALILATLVVGIVRALPRGPKRDRSRVIFLAGAGILLATAIPDMLSGLGLIDVYVAKWGVVAFVVCMGFVLVGRYRDKEVALERRVRQLDDKRREVEALYAELRHQVAERSRDLARTGPSQTRAALPTIGSLVAGRYRIARELGAGAMGCVYEVERTSDGARLALKIMLGHRDDDAARFAREAEIAAKLAHPNLVRVLDVGIGPWGSPFMVMELVPGGSLADAPPRDAASVRVVLAAIARGLEALHAAGVVHRDLKPSNVLVGDPPKLADFGIARVATAAPLDATVPMEDASHLTKTGAFLGTPLYMAPEQAREAATVGPAADVFSFGVLAYELLAGSLPFQMPVVFRALAGASLPPAPTFDGLVPEPAIAAMLGACLSYRPEARPPASALAAALHVAEPTPMETSTDVVPAVGV